MLSIEGALRVTDHPKTFGIWLPISPNELFSAEISPLRLTFFLLAIFFPTGLFLTTFFGIKGLH